MFQRKSKIPIYGGTLIVTLYDVKELPTLKNYYPHIDFDNYNAVTMYKGATARVLIRAGTETPGIIAHESKHVVNYTFERIGQRLDFTNDEAECYFLSWVVNRVHEAVNKYYLK